jgi:hypothetical protein
MSQRWRLSVSRDANAAHVQHRDLTPIWEAILGEVAACAADRGHVGPHGAGEPVDERERGRPRVVFAAPLPLGLTASAELVDLVLPVGRLPRARVRAIVEPRLPLGHTLMDAVDVWIGEPSLPSLVSSARYTVDVAAPAGASPAAVEHAIASLLARGSIPRTGRDPAKAPTNLRALIARLVVDPASGADPAASNATARLRMTLRIDPGLGSCRPEEVVAALGRDGPGLEIVHAHRDGFELREPVRRLPRLTLGGPRPTLTRRTRTRSG